MGVVVLVGTTDVMTTGLIGGSVDSAFASSPDEHAAGARAAMMPNNARAVLRVQPVTMRNRIEDSPPAAFGPGQFLDVIRASR